MSWRLTGRSARGDARWWFAAAVAATTAAAAAYWFDPKQGRSRRIRFSQRSAHIVRAAGSRIGRKSRYVSNTAIQRVKYWMAGGSPGFVDDRTLLDRVDSELFADPTIPRGSLNLEVEGMTVVLRGQLTSREEIERIEAAVRQVPVSGTSGACFT